MNGQNISKCIFVVGKSASANLCKQAYSPTPPHGQAILLIDALVFVGERLNSAAAGRTTRRGLLLQRLVRSRSPIDLAPQILKGVIFHWEYARTPGNGLRFDAPAILEDLLVRRAVEFRVSDYGQCHVSKMTLPASRFRFNKSSDKIPSIFGPFDGVVYQRLFPVLKRECRC